MTAFQPLSFPGFGDYERCPNCGETTNGLLRYCPFCWTRKAPTPTDIDWSRVEGTISGWVKRNIQSVRCDRGLWRFLEKWSKDYVKKLPVPMSFSRKKKDNIIIAVKRVKAELLVMSLFSAKWVLGEVAEEERQAQIMSNIVESLFLESKKNLDPYIVDIIEKNTVSRLNEYTDIMDSDKELPSVYSSWPRHKFLAVRLMHSNVVASLVESGVIYFPNPDRKVSEREIMALIQRTREPHPLEAQTGDLLLNQINYLDLSCFSPEGMIVECLDDSSYACLPTMPVITAVNPDYQGIDAVAFTKGGEEGNMGVIGIGRLFWLR